MLNTNDHHGLFGLHKKRYRECLCVTVRWPTVYCDDSHTLDGSGNGQGVVLSYRCRKIRLFTLRDSRRKQKGISESFIADLFKSTPGMLMIREAYPHRGISVVWYFAEERCFRRAGDSNISIRYYQKVFGIKY